MTNIIERTGIIDGIKTTQELSITPLIWSDASRWLPTTDSGIYVVECQRIDSDKDTHTYYYVCKYTPSKQLFYDHTRQKGVVLADWDRVRWTVLT
jgi:hypothetical protein